jgi:hypothetical protein
MRHDGGAPQRAIGEIGRRGSCRARRRHVIVMSLFEPEEYLRQERAWRMEEPARGCHAPCDEPDGWVAPVDCQAIAVEASNRRLVPVLGVDMGWN